MLDNGNADFLLFGCITIFILAGVRKHLLTGLGAGGCFSAFDFCPVIVTEVMTCCCYVITLVAVAANGTGVGGVALLGAGRSSYDGGIVVLLRVNVVRNVGVTAVCAGVGGITLFGTGGGNSFALLVIVTKYGDLNCIGITANRAGVRLNTGFGAGCYLGDFLTIIVTVCRNRFLCFDDLAANGALFTFGKTGFGAGCILAGNDFFGVIRCRNIFLFFNNHTTVVTLLTCGLAGIGAALFNCGKLDNVNVVIFIYRNGNRLGCIATAAVIFLQAGLCAGCLSDYSNLSAFPIVTEGITVSTATSGALCFFGAGCFAAVAFFGLSVGVGGTIVKTMSGVRSVTVGSIYEIMLQLIAIVKGGRCFGLFKRAASAGIIIEVSVLAGCYLGKVERADGFLIVNVRNQFTVSRATDIALCSFGAGCLAALVRSKLAKGLTTFGAVLCLGAGCPNKSMVFGIELTVGLATSVTYSKSNAGCRAAGVTERIAILFATNGAIRCLGAGSFYPSVIKSFTFGKTALGTILCVSAGCILPAVCLQFTVRLLATFANCLINASCSAANVTELNSVVCNILIAAMAGVSGIALLGAGRSNYLCLIGVTGCRNNRLLYERFVTYRALLTLGKTGFGAGCVLAGNYFLGVSCYGNNRLLYERFATYRTLLTLGKTGFGAGCILAGNNFLGVSCYGNNRLLYERFTADGTLLTLGKTGFGAGCCLAGNDLFGVLGCRNICIDFNVTTNGTGVRGITLFGAGGSRYGCNVIMTCSCDLFDFEMVAMVAVASLFTFKRAGRSGSLYPFAIAMTESYCVVIHFNISASAGIGGVALLGAGRRSYNFFEVVRIGFNGTALFANALMGSIAVGRRILDLFPLAKAVSGSCYVIINVGRATGTGVGSITLLGAGGRSYSSFVAVAKCFDGLAFAMLAVCAFTNLFTRFGAGGCLYGLPLAKAVSGSCYVIINVGRATGTGVGSVTLLGAGGSSYNSGIAVLVLQRATVCKGILLILADLAANAGLVVNSCAFFGSGRFQRFILHGLAIENVRKNVTGYKGILVVFADVTASTGLVVNSCLCASSCRLQRLVLDDLFAVGVSQSCALGCFTNRAGLGICASRLCPIVACCLDCCSFGLAATFARTRLLACCSTGGVLGRCPSAPFMVASGHIEDIARTQCSNTQHNHQQADDTS